MNGIFALQFFRNAFLISFLLSIVFSLLSFFVVMRRMAFLGAGIAHTAFGGIALGILLGFHPFMVSVFFCLASALLIGKLVRHGNIGYDTGIGILFSFSMALGALFIALKGAYTFDLTGYLFGNILSVSSADLILTLVFSCLFLPTMIVTLPKILLLTFDEDIASVSGIDTDFLDTLILVFLALLIVISIKIVGIILVSALVVLPASFGMAVSRRTQWVLLFGTLFTLISMIGGLFLSYALDLPTGATMVVLGTAVYFTALVFPIRRMRPEGK